MRCEHRKRDHIPIGARRLRLFAPDVADALGGIDRAQTMLDFHVRGAAYAPVPTNLATWSQFSLAGETLLSRALKQDTLLGVLRDGALVPQ